MENEDFLKTKTYLVWHNIGMLVLTVCFVFMVIKDRMTYDYELIYVVVVCFPNLLLSYLKLKFNNISTKTLIKNGDQKDVK